MSKVQDLVLFQPTFPETEGTEPSLNQLVFKYYSAHFPFNQAMVFADRYLKQFESEIIRNFISTKE